jgi:hypothetical protein
LIRGFFFPAVFAVSLLISFAGCTETSLLLQDSFLSSSGDWREFYLKGDSGGGTTFSKDKLIITTAGGAKYGVYHSVPVSGHFYVEAAFEADEHVGLALIQAKDGRPDVDNYTMLCVNTNDEGIVVVSVKDRQNGVDNVLDNTGKLRRATESSRRIPFQNADSYEHVLTGRQYSVPFDKTNKRIRIFRDSPAGFFHFYYAVKKNIRGKDASGWMEIAPSRDWADKGQKYYVALVACSDGKAVFDQVEVVPKPTEDKDDRSTGFAATRREFNWSGFFGEAVVATFGDEFKYRDKDIKFVFWSETNYVPAWYLHNQLMYTYEFVETWGGGNPGCHEPMSDRLLRWSRADVVEDNAVRKVVRWHYVLCNPDYKVPDDDKGTQLPEVDEYWTFYPDGSGTRYIVYTPKLDTDFRSRHELSELITLAGSSSHSKPFFSSPALTFLNLEGDTQDAHPGPKFDYGSHLDDWDQMIMAVHLKNEPDIFCVFSTDEEIPETYSGYGVEYENAWQSVNGRHSHWPVSKRPFTGNNGSGGTWKAEVSHSCLVSCGVIKGTDWEDHFKVDDRGRKYRDWVLLVGANEPGDYEGLRDKTRSWLYQGNITVPDNSCRFLKNDYSHRILVFEKAGTDKHCNFEIAPHEGSSVLVNPAFRINGWGANQVRSIRINDKTLPKNKYRIDLLDGRDLLVWMNMTIDSKTRFVIGAK